MKIFPVTASLVAFFTLRILAGDGNPLLLKTDNLRQAGEQAGRVGEVDTLGDQRIQPCVAQ